MPQNKTSQDFGSLQDPPWAMAPDERAAFLSSFLDADVANADVVRRLRAKEGRGLFRGQHADADYVQLKRELWDAQRAHAREMSGPPHKRLGAGYAIVSGWTDDIRRDVQRHAVRVPMRRAYASIYDVPAKPTTRTLSLAGELALAMHEKLERAQSQVTCPYCGLVELFPDPRPRKICGRPECRRRYVREYQKAHDDSAPRVRKHRAEKGGKGGKTRKR